MFLFVLTPCCAKNGISLVYLHNWGVIREWEQQQRWDDGQLTDRVKIFDKICRMILKSISDLLDLLVVGWDGLGHCEERS